MSLKASMDRIYMYFKTWREA